MKWDKCNEFTFVWCATGKKNKQTFIWKKPRIGKSLKLVSEYLQREKLSTGGENEIFSFNFSMKLSTCWALHPLSISCFNWKIVNKKKNLEKKMFKNNLLLFRWNMRIRIPILISILRISILRISISVDDLDCISILPWRRKSWHLNARVQWKMRNFTFSRRSHQVHPNLRQSLQISLISEKKKKKMNKNKKNESF